MSPPRQRTMIYVDGFNLYYGALKGTPHRWLDLGALSARLLQPRNQIMGIKYFTAKVQPRPGNPQQAQRQQIYFRALNTIPGLEIHYGHFLTRPAMRRLTRAPGRGSPYREVWNTEEKGSDVNLASHLLIDGFRDRYDIAVVVTNDSDLKTPIAFVREDLKAPVGILNPHKNRSWALSPAKLPANSFYKPIRKGALAACQFPNTLTDEHGAFTKPSSW